MKTTMMWAVLCLFSACAVQQASAPKPVEDDSVQELSARAASSTSLGIVRWQAQMLGNSALVTALDARAIPLARLRIERSAQLSGLHFVVEAPEPGEAIVTHEGVLLEASSARTASLVSAFRDDVGMFDSPERELQDGVVDVGVTTSELKIYGNYCGPDYGDDTGRTPAVDAVDQACKAHDACYARTNYFNCGCDRELLAAVPLAAATTGTPEAVAASVAIVGFFSGLPCVCVSWVCAFLGPLCTGVGGQSPIC